MNLDKWWASLTPEQKAQVDRRAPVLDPNTDLAGEHDARYGRADADRRPRAPTNTPWEGGQ